jgi:hypothetical protein
MYYSYKGAYPTKIPARIVLSDGRTKTDPSTYTAADIVDAGYKEVSIPPEVKYPEVLDWDGNNWIVRSPNKSEIAFKVQVIKDECKKRLSDTDFKVVKSLESGIPLEEDFKAYRQELRDLYNNVESMDVWNIKYPSPPVVEEE